MEVENIIALFVGVATGIKLLTGAVKDIHDMLQNKKKKKKRRTPSKKKRRN